jgi:type I restriction enzyme, S subunit
MNTNLPSNWISSSLADVTSFLSRGISPIYIEQGGIEVINQKCIRDHKVNSELSRRHDISAKSVPENKIVQVWDGLVNSTGVGTLGRVAQVTELLEQTTVDSHVTIVRPKKDLIHEPFFGLMLRKIEQEIEQLGRGAVGQIELPRTQLASLAVTYPKSKNEQQKIVERIEELFSVIDKQLNELSHLLKMLADVEYSYLKSVFQQYKMIPLSEVADVISGQHILSNKYNSDKLGIGYLTGPADFGEVYPSISKWTEHPKVISNTGDVLITVKGAGVGKLNILDVDDVAISRQLMAIRSNKLMPKFIYYQFKAQYLYFQSQGTGSTVPGLNRNQILTKLIAYCALEEQQILVDKVDSFLSIVGNSAKSVKILIKSAKSLKQSILKKAFEGQLL